MVPSLCVELSQARGHQLLNCQIFADDLFSVGPWAAFWGYKDEHAMVPPFKDLKDLCGRQTNK